MSIWFYVSFLLAWYIIINAAVNWFYRWLGKYTIIIGRTKK